MMQKHKGHLLKTFFIMLLLFLIVSSSTPFPRANALILSPSDADTYLNTGAPTSNYGSVSSINVEALGGFLQRILVKFDLTSIPSGSTVTQANLHLYAHGYAGSPSGTTLTVYQVTEEWAETQATWNARLTGVSWTGINPAGAGGTWTTDGAVSSPAVSGGWVIWDVTEIVKSWIEGGESNYGFIIKVTDETSSSYWGLFASREYSTANERPFLEILGPPDPQQPSSGSNPVGGTILPINELMILAPYLALIGLVATLSTVYLVKKKRKT